MTLREFLRPDILAFLIPIVAIITGGAIAITTMIIKHRERIALIEQGLHPDYPPDQSAPPEGQDGPQEK